MRPHEGRTSAVHRVAPGSEGHKTLSNWYTTLLNAYGNPIEHYGDLDLKMQRNRLPQTGAIDQFRV